MPGRTFSQMMMSEVIVELFSPSSFLQHQSRGTSVPWNESRLTGVRSNLNVHTLTGLLFISLEVPDTEHIVPVVKSGGSFSSAFPFAAAELQFPLWEEFSITNWLTANFICSGLIGWKYTYSCLLLSELYSTVIKPRWALQITEEKKNGHPSVLIQ